MLPAKTTQNGFIKSFNGRLGLCHIPDKMYIMFSIRTFGKMCYAYRSEYKRKVHIIVDREMLTAVCTLHTAVNISKKQPKLITIRFYASERFCQFKRINTRSLKCFNNLVIILLRRFHLLFSRNNDLAAD